MNGHFIADIETDTIKNGYYRKVMYTSSEGWMQLTYMSISPGREIGMEIHKGDQFIRVEAGQGIAEIGAAKYFIEDGIAFIIPSGVCHNVKNTGISNLKLYSIYSPPQHAPGLIEQ